MSSSILRVKDNKGNWIQIPAIKGDKGADGTMSFEDLTEEQRLSLRGEDGEDGVDGLTPYIKNGTWWIGEEDTGVPASSNVAIGSYTGTGLYGSANPNTLTFDFTPKFLLISHNKPNSTGDCLALFFKNNSASINFKNGNESMQHASGSTVTFSDRAVSWYSVSYSDTQLNQSDKTYYYVAIG